MIVVSVIVGLVAVVMASQWINKQTNVSAQKVVIAAVDVDLGSKLTPEMLKLIDWPSGSIPEGAIIDPQTLDGRVLKTSVLRGEAILESKLAPLGTKGGLSAVVMEGKRAMTVRVNDVIGVAGFALPGNYVDILVNTTEDAKANVKEKVDMSISKIVLEHILVLAVAQEASRDDTKPKVVNAVTLEVTPEQAEKLDLARSVGTLSLVLRNQVDPKPVETSGITKQILLRGDEPAPVAKPVAASKPVAKRVVKKVIVKRPAQPAPIAATQNCVEIVSGTSRHIECF
ncbi:Flp pilus assembly protein CpaB [Vogesella indigofera]|uniref:Flp pilus assembly protein CpaB n=1 Tax=Vogesella indigofera TaxID=45465 RepID=UPI00234EFF6A|nr:Flp pilus assembly protein CpaB [Vogesella indigofera]MDC7712177.1 Flp pilus assembly protein CpaB [Vogesella indigofera]